MNVQESVLASEGLDSSFGHVTFVEKRDAFGEKLANIGSSLEQSSAEGQLDPSTLQC